MNIPEILAGIRASGLVRPAFLAREDMLPETRARYAQDYSVAGFGIVATREGFPAVLERFPWLAPFMSAISQHSNAVYMNPVIARAGSRMVSHLDNTLCDFNPKITHAHEVTIFYVAVEGLIGGRLVIEGERPIYPAAGLCVKFVGTKHHEVERVKSGRRVSLVLEEYRLTDEELQGIPVFALR